MILLSEYATAGLACMCMLILLSLDLLSVQYDASFYD